ncbi:MAG: hypothetical protein IJI35_04035 [Kiritimatiellae bacterium]|nr:hypothetical protein [Kiritimatiellia bacterium]
MKPAMDVTMKEVCAYMRMGGHRPDGALAERVEALVADVRGVLRPAHVWRRVGIEDVPCPSSTLLRHLDGCGDAFLVCGTLGAGVDALQRRLSAVSGADALIVQAVGAAFMERWMDETESCIQAELSPGEEMVRRYSPGYGDWPLEAQRGLLAALDTPRAIGVSLTDSMLMVPSKSVSAVIGVKAQI